MRLNSGVTSAITVWIANGRIVAITKPGDAAPLEFETVKGGDPWHYRRERHT
jgi:hypothetical protein